MQVFSFYSGSMSSRLENLEVQHFTCPVNYNDGLTVKDCRILDETYFGDVLIGSYADMSLESCWIGCMYEDTLPIELAEPASIVFLDCIIAEMYTDFGSYIPPGSRLEIRNCTFMGPVTVWPHNAYWAQYSMHIVNCIMPWGRCREIVPDTLEWRFNDFTDDGHAYPIGTYLGGNFTADPLFCGGPTDFRIDYESPCRGAGEGGEDVGARLGYCNVPQDIEPEIRCDGAPLWMSPVWPNPTRAGAGVAYRGRPNEMIDIRLFDVRGRVIDEQRCVATGTHQLYRWDGRGAKGHLVPGGTYFLDLQGRNERVAKRIVVIR